MPLGWIDFSRSERNKVMSVLDLLSEPGTLDELGIAPIRDGYANMFFPGTSTIQTRAKYFLIVPYTLKDIERSTELNPERCLRIFADSERKCAEHLLETDDKEGVIGRRALSQGGWVKRAPSEIYWAGLRKFGILTGGDRSIRDYISAICWQKGQKEELKNQGNRHDNAEEFGVDDKDAGSEWRKRLLNIPTYGPEWRKELSIKLTAEEGAFLKKQIIDNCPDSMFAYILKFDKTEILNCNSFLELGELIRDFPEPMQCDYQLAFDFSLFINAIWTLYNVIVSDGKNEEANKEWAYLRTQLGAQSEIDLESIFARLGIFRNMPLVVFLRKSREAMEVGDENELRNLIVHREHDLKLNRAKTQHPGEYDPKAWFCGKYLDYRFGNAQTIIRDIWESEGLC